MTAFDFSPMIGGAWSNRFVVYFDPASGHLNFLTYGSRFAELLELPEEQINDFPINRPIPGRYLPLFIEGCRDAITRAAPVRSSGVLVEYGQIELYRTAFMPLASRQNSSMRLVFGTFNRRLGPNAHASDAVRAMYNSLTEDIRSRQGLAPHSRGKRAVTMREHSER